MNGIKICCCVGLLLAATMAEAQVRVNKGAGQKASFNMSAFQASAGGGATLFRRTLEADLNRSGWFKVTPGAAEFVLQGGAQDDGSSVSSECRVYDSASTQCLLGKNYNCSAAEARALAHRVADDIINAVTGRKGFFSAKLAVVGNPSGVKQIYLCDSDGQNVRQITIDKKISIGPYWAPDGEGIFYTSFRSGYPDVYKIDLRAAKLQRIAGESGMNSGGAVSPDGRYVALILSKDGNPDLYVKSLQSGQLTRLTSTKPAAEASPTWSPDGSMIAFVSDRSGSPQIYVMSRAGGEARRLTSRGSQNVAPDWGANGLIAFSSLIGVFTVCIMDPQTLEVKTLTSGDANYEDPSWAPDGRHLACGRKARGGRSSVYLLDSMGDPPIALLESSGDWTSPAWSPR